VNNIAEWDGSDWSPLGSGVSAPLLGDVINSLILFDDGSGEALHAGGIFPSAPESGDSYLAKWGCLDILPPVLNVPASLTVFDCKDNGQGELVDFVVTATDDQDSAPSVVCMPPSGSLFLHGKTTVTCTATDAAGNQSTAHFVVRVNRKGRH